jgi:hypothetical protein
MATSKKKFNAVLASRRWKEAVARKTAGMNAGQVLAFFNRDQALSRMQSSRKRMVSPVAAH